YYPVWLSYATAQLSPFVRVRLVDAVAKGWSLNAVVSDAKAFRPDFVVVDTSWASLENDLAVMDILEEECVCEAVPFGVPFKTDDFALRRRLVPREKMGLDEVPFVSIVYEHFLNVEDYFQTNVLHPHSMVFAGRGCPHRCTFCSRMDGNVNQMRSVDNVLDEILWTQTFLSQVREVLFEDATFTVNKRWTHKFCEAVQTRNVDFVWSCQVRADVSLKLLKSMHKARCRLVICGFESGSDHILRGIKKGLTVHRAKKFAKNVKKSGLMLQADFIIGLPNETKETIRHTRKLIREISPDIVQVSIATPYPRTEFYDWVKSNGFLLNNPPRYLDENGFQLCTISYPELSAKEIQDAVDETLRSYYLSLRFAWRAFHQVFRKNGWQELKRLWRSAKAFQKH
ncbi:MAG: radical SAM protein, partial [Desulfobacterales bacterium]|nr:radical SAM protein [Desulfobacterales bacterium]